MPTYTLNRSNISLTQHFAFKTCFFVTAVAACLPPFARQGGLDVWADASSQMGNKSNAQSIKQIPVKTN